MAVENIATRQFDHGFSCNEIIGFSAAFVDRLGLPTDVALAMKANVAVIQALEAQIAGLEARLKKKGEGNAKNGNAYLIWAFIEAANFARRFSDDAKRFFEKKKAKTNGVVAAKALAHKLARASYHILKEKQPFDAKRCFA